MNAPENQPKELPWWLGGEEYCDWCLQQYAVEVEYRCQACDGPVCPDCVVELTVSRSLLCPDCAEETADDPGSDS